MPTFTATIEEAGRGGAMVRVPDDVVAALGGGRIKATARFDDAAYRGSVVTMVGAKVIGILKSVQTQIGKGPGDTITVTLERDDEERMVPVPDDLRVALDAADVADRFAATSYTRRREIVMSIESATGADTRARRVRNAVEQLAAGD